MLEFLPEKRRDPTSDTGTFGQTGSRWIGIRSGHLHVPGQDGAFMVQWCPGVADMEAGQSWMLHKDTVSTEMCLASLWDTKDAPC